MWRISFYKGIRILPLKRSWIFNPGSTIGKDPAPSLSLMQIRIQHQSHMSGLNHAFLIDKGLDPEPTIKGIQFMILTLIEFRIHSGVR